MDSILFKATQRLPKVIDQDPVSRGFDAWNERASALDDEDARSAALGVASDPNGRKLLEALFANSPFLTSCLLKEIPVFLSFLRQGPETALKETWRELTEAVSNLRDRDGIKRELRIARRRAALIIGLGDTTELWKVDLVIKALSDAAEMLISAALAFLLKQAHDRSELELPDPENPCRDCGYVILGMGKLGGRELNYSSDVDLIVLFDPEKTRYRHQRGPQEGYVRLTRELVRLLDDRTGDGYVCRTDFRLRPDPAAMPMAVTYQAALLYYESLGQNWERAAMIKARPVAGDLDLGESFLTELTPFVWRKNLDFWAIQDIHSIKRQIHAEKGGAQIALLDHNIKLGRGGIREIEFFAQTQQLIWGGREPSLRCRGTIQALTALCQAGHIDAAALEELSDSYAFLRRVENRLQMVEDRQTHNLPADTEGIAQIAAFLGYDEPTAFESDILMHLRQVEDHYAGLFEDAPSLSGPGNLVFTGGEPDPSTLATLKNLGFRDGDLIFRLISGWHRGRYRACRSTRSRELLTEIVPTLLEEAGKTADPDQALVGFDQFLSRLPAGVQLFSLLHANPQLLTLIAEIMGGAPALSQRLSAHVHLLDSVLTPGFFDPLPPLDALSEELRGLLANLRDFEDALNISRRWANDHRFQIGVHLLRHSEEIEEISQSYSDIAQAVVSRLLAPAEEEVARKHGRFPGAGMAVLGLGKLGSREMTVSSDLDLILIYDLAGDVPAEFSDGAKPLDVNRYFLRLGQSYINALTARTQEGTLYEIDTRLRPSGKSGPLATALKSFKDYHASESWTWEHMALTRARVVAGEPGLADRISKIIQDVLTRSRDHEALRKDVAEMRARIARERPAKNIWDVKDTRGGLVDLEFLAQYLQLRHAAETPDILDVHTSSVFGKAAMAGVLTSAQARELAAATKLIQQVQGTLRLVNVGVFEPTEAPHGLKQRLATACGSGSFGELEENLRETTSRVIGYFEDIVGESTADLAPGKES